MIEHLVRTMSENDADVAVLGDHTSRRRLTMSQPGEHRIARTVPDIISRMRCRGLGAIVLTSNIYRSLFQD